jgi:hypothetical protein
MHTKITKRTQAARRGNGRMPFLVFALAPSNATGGMDLTTKTNPRMDTCSDLLWVTHYTGV